MAARPEVIALLIPRKSVGVLVLLFIVPFVSVSPAESVSIVYGPLVAPVDPVDGTLPTSARVIWWTDTATSSNAAFAAASPEGPWVFSASDPATGTRHEALISGLSSDAIYYARVTSDGVESGPVEFRTGENLLVNGSLETWHAVSGAGWGSEEPDGWQGWEIHPWAPPGSNNPDHISIQMDRPTGVPTPASTEGSHRAGMDEGWRSCYGGLYQTVTDLAPGTYTISGWASWLFQAVTSHEKHFLEIVAKDGSHVAGIPPSGTALFRQYSPGSEPNWKHIQGEVECSTGTVTLYLNLRSDNFDGASFAHFDGFRLMAKEAVPVRFSNFQSVRTVDGQRYDVTISYDTDIPCTTQVQLGSITSALDPALVTHHVVDLEGIEPQASAYTWRARATAPPDIDVYSTFQTLKAPLVAFSAINAAVEAQIGTVCTVSWSTNYPTSQNNVYYREFGSPDYLVAAEVGGGATSQHSVALASLALGKSYQYYVSSGSPDIVTSASSVRTFSTPAQPGQPDLYIGMSMIGGPLANGGDDVGPALEVQRMIQTDLDAITITGSLRYSWPEVQPADPGDGPNVYDWSSGDAALPGLIPGKARSSYFQMYGSTPSWLTQDTPRFWQKFEEFVEAMTIHINRVHGDVDFTFENEPNISRAPSGWHWADWYIHCLQHFYAAVHRADSVTGKTNRVIAGNLAGHSASGFAELYARGLKDCSDVLGYHPYPYDIRDGLDVLDLAQIHATQVQYGDGAKKILVSEGWGSGRSAGFDRSSPEMPLPPEEVENMYLAMVNGWDNVMTPRQNWDPEYLYGMKFFCGNDNWGARNWRSRAIPKKDAGGNITGFIVDGYHMTPDIAPQFWNGGMLDWYGNSKDCLLHVFPGNGLVFMNPGFEIASSPPRANQPHFWQASEDPAAVERMYLDDSIVHGGSRSLRISPEGTGSLHVSQMSVKRSVIPGLTYRARVWARTSGSSTARFYLLFASLDGIQKSTPVFAQDVTGAGDWTMMEVQAAAPAFAGRAEVGCISAGEGTAWFDDVTISRAEQSETGVVRGYTLDEQQVPVANCLVRTTTGGYQAVSDEYGFYEMTGLRTGTYDFVCRKAGYVPSRISNQTVAAEKLTLVSYHMGLVKPGLTVTGLASSAPTALAGEAVSVTVQVQNEKPYPVVVSEVGCFVEQNGGDATADFDIAPSPANPKVIPALSGLPFGFELYPRQSAAGGVFSINAYAFGQEDRPNLLANGGFDMTDPFYHWGMWGSSNVCDWIADSSQYVSPPRSLKNVASDPGGDKFNWAGNYSPWGPAAVPAKPDTNYIVGAYHKDNTEGRVALNLYIEEFYFDGNDHLYNGRHFAAVQQRDVWSHDAMIYLTGNPVQTPGLYSTNRLRVSVGSYIGQAGASTTAWWDDVYLKEQGDWLADDRADAGASLAVPRRAASIADARAASDGEIVQIDGLIITAGEGTFPGRLYAEQPDRAAGIALVPAPSEAAPAGSSVTVTGAVGLIDGEPALVDAVIATSALPGIPDPLRMNNRDLAFGNPTSLALLVTVAGRVTHSSPDGMWLALDDGSQLTDGEGHVGLKVINAMGGAAVPQGSFVVVTGISGREDDGARAVLRVRSESDIRYE